jgi:UDP-GlcNAc:undecaprenyl-phosphate GlcNAc-1-phosphate transferase
MTQELANAVALGGAAALVAVTLCLRFTLPWLSLHAVDNPNHRSSHTSPVPRGGGASIVAGVLIGAVIGYWHLNLAPPLYAVVSAGSMAAMMAVGLVDDLRSLSSRIRLAVQLALSLTVASALMVGFSADVFALMGIAFGVAALVNAFNFMDGINGISGLVAASVASWLAGCSLVWGGDRGLTIACAVVACSAVAFLPWNMLRARVFLGDSGSYGLGFALSVLSAWAWLSGVPLIVATAPLFIYMADVLWAMGSKLRAGLAWDAPHRRHAYQRLSDGGWSHQKVALIVAGYVLVAGLAGALTHRWPPVGWLALAAVVSAYLALPAIRLRTSMVRA